MLKSLVAAVLLASAISAPALAQKGASSSAAPVERCVSTLTNEEAARRGIATGKGSGESVQVIATGNKTACE